MYVLKKRKMGKAEINFVGEVPEHALRCPNFATGS
jgi:hypothetical protein